jgi:O-antigen/teichoic acid export membrane protein
MSEAALATAAGPAGGAKTLAVEPMRGGAPGAIAAPSVGRGLLERLARGAIVALAIQVAGAGLAYLSQVALARWMGISQFGLYAYLVAWATVLALLAGLGFPISVLRFIPEYRALGDRARLRGLVRLSRRATLLAGLALAALCLAVVLAVSGRASAALALAALLVPLGALVNLDSAITRAGGRVARAYAPNLMARPALILAGAGAVWLAGGRLQASTGLAITAGAFATVALVQSSFVRGLPWSGEARPRAGDAQAREAQSDARETGSGALYERRAWLRVSGPLLLVAGFQVALSQTDLLIVGAVGGVRHAAFYLAATRTATLVSYLLVATASVTAPLFAEFEARGDRAGLQRLVAVSAQWIFWPTLALAGGLALLAPYVLGLFGPHFAVARWALIILLVGQLVNAGCGAVGYLLSMTGHQDDTARVYGITSVFNVALCYAGVRLYGLNGAAFATTVSLIVWNVWLYRLTVKRLGIRASLFACFDHRQERSRSGGH